MTPCLKSKAPLPGRCRMPHRPCMGLTLVALLWLAAGPPPGAAEPPAEPPAGPPAGPWPAPPPTPAAGPAPATRGMPPPRIERLDRDRVRIGSIVVDRSARRFVVPGTFVWEQGPLEFVATARGGAKSYESLIELDADAFEFNLAAILVGLKAPWARPARFHFDPQPAVGPMVRITATWVQDGAPLTRPVGQLLPVSPGRSVAEAWAYVGSGYTAQGEFLAALDGTLISFVHAPAALIEHVEGLGLGDYGAVGGAPATLPPAGTPVELTIEAVPLEAALGDLPEAVRAEFAAAQAAAAARRAEQERRRATAAPPATPAPVPVPAPAPAPADTPAPLPDPAMGPASP